MRRRTVAAALVILNVFVSFGIKAADCDEDSIRKVSADGDIIVMMSGHVYSVLPGDEIDSMLWLPAEDVLICARSMEVKGKVLTYYEIINTDEAEKVGATLEQ